jgi:Ala-tRNA(Pro) deacylase
MTSSITPDASHDIHGRLIQLLDEHGARYQRVTHANAGRSEEVALARGTEVGQGAKALACRLSMPDGSEQYALAVLPADRRLATAELARVFNATKAKLLSPDETERLTRCRIGAIPPFSFSSDLILACDSALPDRYETIAFNAGRLDESVLLNVEDYLRIAKPVRCNISQ